MRVLGMFSYEASDDRTGQTGTAVWIRSFKYAGVEEDIFTLLPSEAEVYMESTDVVTEAAAAAAADDDDNDDVNPDLWRNPAMSLRSEEL